MDNERLEILLEKFAQRKMSEAEFNELCDLINENENTAAIKAILEKKPESLFIGMDNTRKNKMLEQILRTTNKDMKEEKVLKMFPLTRVAAAAVILILLSVGGYFYFRNTDSQKQIATSETPQQFKNDVPAPQTNKAVLTLDDGSKIVLDSATNGSLAVQGDVNVVKNADGQIVYKGNTTEIKYNTLTVPKGSKPVQLQLADGSNVWLNVASSITYPTAFAGKERKVQITGEAYFEVAPLAPTGGQGKVPFIVSANGMQIEVIGTHFNVNAYDDESVIKTTLLEGSVRVSKGNVSQLIKPGQQAVVTNDNNELIKVAAVDVDEVVAWKNGLFHMTSSDIQSILRQVSRWYDVQVEYEGAIPAGHITGKVPRNMNLSQVLKVLELSGVHFRMENATGSDRKKIVVVK